MKPGRELDAVVAEKVMGCQKLMKYTNWIKQFDAHCECENGSHNDSEIEGIPCYSSDIRSAWLVVEKLHKDGWQFDLELYAGEPACACFFKKRDEWGMQSAQCAGGDTASHAICLVALKVVGVDLSSESLGDSPES